MIVFFKTSVLLLSRVVHTIQLCRMKEKLYCDFSSPFHLP